MRMFYFVVKGAKRTVGTFIEKDGMPSEEEVFQAAERESLPPAPGPYAITWFKEFRRKEDFLAFKGISGSTEGTFG